MVPVPVERSARWRIGGSPRGYPWVGGEGGGQVEDEEVGGQLGGEVAARPPLRLRSMDNPYGPWTPTSLLDGGSASVRGFVVLHLFRQELDPLCATPV